MRVAIYPTSKLSEVDPRILVSYGPEDFQGAAIEYLLTSPASIRNRRYNPR